jgi:hypothetical protein
MESKQVTIDCNIGQSDGYCSADDEEISTNPADIIADLKDRNPRKRAFEKALEDKVIKFYNNAKANVLEPLRFLLTNWTFKIYPFFERDHALGQSGFQAHAEKLNAQVLFHSIFLLFQLLSKT